MALWLSFLAMFIVAIALELYLEGLTILLIFVLLGAVIGLAFYWMMKFIR